MSYSFQNYTQFIKNGHRFVFVSGDIQPPGLLLIDSESGVLIVDRSKPPTFEKGDEFYNLSLIEGYTRITRKEYLELHNSEWLLEAVEVPNPVEELEKLLELCIKFSQDEVYAHEYRGIFEKIKLDDSLTRFQQAKENFIKKFL